MWAFNWPVVMKEDSHTVHRWGFSPEWVSFVILQIVWLNCSIIALVALVRFLPSVNEGVSLQITRISASESTLVTLEWLFSCVLPHHVEFQLISCNAEKLASCAPVRLFPGVGPFVVLQTVWPSCIIISLFAFLQFLSSVIHNVLSRIGSLIGWIIALCTLLVWFLSGVNKGVPLQITSLAKWLVALWTIVSLDRTVGLLVSPKATSTCKCLGTLVTRLSICHLLS